MQNSPEMSEIAKINRSFDKRMKTVKNFHKNICNNLEYLSCNCFKILKTSRISQTGKIKKCEAKTIRFLMTDDILWKYIDNIDGHSYDTDCIEAETINFTKLFFNSLTENLADYYAEFLTRRLTDRGIFKIAEVCISNLPPERYVNLINFFRILFGGIELIDENIEFFSQLLSKVISEDIEKSFVILQSIEDKILRGFKHFKISGQSSILNALLWQKEPSQNCTEWLTDFYASTLKKYEKSPSILRIIICLFIGSRMFTICDTDFFQRKISSESYIFHKCLLNKMRDKDVLCQDKVNDSEFFRPIFLCDFILLHRVLDYNPRLLKNDATLLKLYIDSIFDGNNILSNKYIEQLKSIIACVDSNDAAIFPLNLITNALLKVSDQFNDSRRSILLLKLIEIVLLSADISEYKAIEKLIMCITSSHILIHIYKVAHHRLIRCFKLLSNSVNQVKYLMLQYNLSLIRISQCNCSNLRARINPINYLKVNADGIIQLIREIAESSMKLEAKLGCLSILHRKSPNVFLKSFTQWNLIYNYDPDNMQNIEIVHEALRLYIGISETFLKIDKPKNFSKISEFCLEKSKMYGNRISNSTNKLQDVALDSSELLSILQLVDSSGCKTYSRSQLIFALPLIITMIHSQCSSATGLIISNLIMKTFDPESLQNADYSNFVHCVIKHMMMASKKNIDSTKYLQHIIDYLISATLYFLDIWKTIPENCAKNRINQVLEIFELITYHSDREEILKKIYLDVMPKIIDSVLMPETLGNKYLITSIALCKYFDFQLMDNFFEKFEVTYSEIMNILSLGENHHQSLIADLLISRIIQKEDLHCRNIKLREIFIMSLERNRLTKDRGLSFALLFQTFLDHYVNDFGSFMHESIEVLEELFGVQYISFTPYTFDSLQESINKYSKLIIIYQDKVLYERLWKFMYSKLEDFHKICFEIVSLILSLFGSLSAVYKTRESIQVFLNIQLTNHYSYDLIELNMNCFRNCLKTLKDETLIMFIKSKIFKIFETEDNLWLLKGAARCFVECMKCHNHSLATNFNLPQIFIENSTSSRLSSFGNLEANNIPIKQLIILYLESKFNRKNKIAILLLTNLTKLSFHEFEPVFLQTLIDVINLMNSRNKQLSSLIFEYFECLVELADNFYLQNLVSKFSDLIEIQTSQYYNESVHYAAISFFSIIYKIKPSSFIKMKCQISPLLLQFKDSNLNLDQKLVDFLSNL